MLCIWCFLAIWVGLTCAQIGHGRTSNRVVRPIPPAILARLSTVRSLRELQHGFNISVASGTNMRSRTTSNNRAVSTFTAPRDLSRNAQPPSQNVEDMSRTVVRIVDDAKPGRAICKPIDRRTTLPFKRERDHFYFPECVDVATCFGGCCSGSDACRPSKKETVRFVVKQFQYLGNTDLLEKEDILVDVEAHLTCTCEQECEEDVQCEANEEQEDCRCIQKSDDYVNPSGDTQVPSQQLDYYGENK